MIPVERMALAAKYLSELLYCELEGRKRGCKLSADIEAVERLDRAQIQGSGGFRRTGCHRGDLAQEFLLVVQTESSNLKEIRVLVDELKRGTSCFFLRRALSKAFRRFVKLRILDLKRRSKIEMRTDDITPSEPLSLDTQVMLSRLSAEEVVLLRWRLMEIDQAEACRLLGLKTKKSLYERLPALRQKFLGA